MNIYDAFYGWNVYHTLQSKKLIIEIELAILLTANVYQHIFMYESFNIILKQFMSTWKLLFLAQSAVGSGCPSVYIKLATDMF